MHGGEQKFPRLSIRHNIYIWCRYLIHYWLIDDILFCPVRCRTVLPWSGERSRVPHSHVVRVIHSTAPRLVVIIYQFDCAQSGQWDRAVDQRPTMSSRLLICLRVTPTRTRMLLSYTTRYSVSPHRPSVRRLIFSGSKCRSTYAVVRYNGVSQLDGWLCDVWQSIRSERMRQNQQLFRENEAAAHSLRGRASDNRGTTHSDPIFVHIFIIIPFGFDFTRVLSAVDFVSSLHHFISESDKEVKQRMAQKSVNKR